MQRGRGTCAVGCPLIAGGQRATDAKLLGTSKVQGLQNGARFGLQDVG